MRYAAVVLAGGAAARMDGRPKPVLTVHGRTLLDRVLDAVADAAPRVVVGPADLPVPAGATLTSEEPAGGGPVAGLAAGLAVVPADAAEVAVLATDLPFLTPSAVAALREALPGHDGAMYVDDTGRPQRLCAVWRPGALRTRLHALGEPAGQSIGRLIDGLRIAEVRAPASGPPPWYDCDTHDDLRRAEEWRA